MGVRGERDVDLEHVAADDAARRVHEHAVADRRRFGVQALQHAQRAVVPIVQDGSIAARILAAPVGEFEPALPGHAGLRERRHSGFTVTSITRTGKRSSAVFIRPDSAAARRAAAIRAVRNRSGRGTRG